MELTEPKVFLLARMVSLAEAQGLSLAHGSTTPTPPPPEPTPPPVPRVNVGDLPAGGGTVGVIPQVVVPVGRTPVPTVVKVVVEGEDLVRTGKFQVNGGRIGVQPMAGFGPGWSGNAQLLWVGGAVGAVLDLIVEVAVAGRYAVLLCPTMAPDYGNLDFEVDGKPSSFSFTGFQPKVMPTGSFPIGNFVLSPGPHRVSMMITGRSPKSTGYLVGIDRIMLTRIGS